MFENVDGKEFVDVSDGIWAKTSCGRAIKRGSAFADLNNDGFMDVVVTSLEPKAAHPS